jgi:hypothetical protein
MSDKLSFSWEMVIAPTTSMPEYYRKTGIYGTLSNLFNQLVALFSGVQFYELLLKHGAERYSKGIAFENSLYRSCSASLRHGKA